MSKVWGHAHPHQIRPNTAKYGCKDDDASDENQHAQGKEKTILWPENLTEDGKLSVDNIEKQ